MQLLIKTVVQLNDPHLRVVSNAKRLARGKPAAPVLIRPVKANSKRAAFLRWVFTNSKATINECMSHFGMSRQNVFAYWTAIHRDHGVGYEFSGDLITPLLPASATPEDVLGAAR